MSQDYFTGKGKGKSPERPAPPEEDNNDDDVGQQPAAPKPLYMTVGTGSTSVHAARLQEMLAEDSGYGGSITGEDGLIPGSPAWEAAVGADRIAHSGSSSTDPEADRRLHASAIHQLWYNQHRVALGRSINQAIDLLKGLQEMNVAWPAHYPTVQKSDASEQRPSSRPGFQHAYSTAADVLGSSSSAPLPSLKRSMTTFDETKSAESSKDAESRVPPEPRLVTPQIAKEFSVLKLDLKLGSLHQTELVHSLEKGSIASLLDGKISSSIKHLLSLRERIEDTSSKVLITGDLNAGKSTFCNALLRRKILPEDQQPCTSIFCEVLDARENSGVEEVHAIHLGATYDRNDETTYDVFSIQELEKLVVDNSKYMQCKVYVRDARTINESLLNNGVVDIALIDAPGLNSDTTKTTAVFARQEEIDVVVFVVSAANHFTMTASEFLRAAAAEKAYLFIVVNGFDTIRDKERCQKMILDQVFGLSPRTYKEASELVHFVSSNAIPTASSPPGGPGGGGGGSASGGGGGDDPSSDSSGKGKDKEKLQDFEKLEQSLRRFVLEKRARSKLAPAKNYLVNILNDVNSLATVNSEVAQSEIDRVSQELDEIEPQLESNKKAKTEVGTEIERTIEETCKDVYDHSRASISFSITHAGEGSLGVQYPGLLGAFQFAEDVKEAMLSRIAASVAECEDVARSKTVGGVNAIKQLGILHLGNEYNNLTFRSDVMFRRKRDALARQIDLPTELWDFVDWPTILQQQEKVAGTGMALTVATAAGGRLIGGYGWMDHALSTVKVVGNDNLRRLIVPAIVLVTVAAAGYVLNQIPQSLPRRLAAKVSTQLAAIDYVHANSSRIAGSVRKVLRFPADSLRDSLNRSVDDLGKRREETLKVRAESEIALKYFGNLVGASAKQKTLVESVDLDAHPPGSVT
jgi:mitofusin 2